MNSFQAYSCFLAINNHFKQSSYDYFKYHGKIRADENAFAIRKDNYQFVKLGKMFTEKFELELYLFTAYSFYDVGWIHDVFSPEIQNLHNNILKFKSSALRYFEQDLTELRNQQLLLNIFDYKNNSTVFTPKIFKLTSLNPMTKVILLDQFDRFKVYSQVDSPATKEYNFKYNSFYQINREFIQSKKGDLAKITQKIFEIA